MKNKPQPSKPTDRPIDLAINKAIAVCEKRRDDLISQQDWFAQMNHIYYDLCNSDPFLGAFVLSNCGDLVPASEWEQWYESDQELRPEETPGQLSLF